jgi:hypothetical protein
MLAIDEYNTRYYLEDIISSFDPHGSPFDIWDNCREMALRYRVLALYKLLLTANVEEFCCLLSKAAQCWIYYLMRVFIGLPTSPEYCCLSYRGPFIAALAAGDFDTATILSLFTLKHYENEVEDLDDFLYTLFLHQMLLRIHEDEGFITKVLADYREETKELGTSRVAVCEALYERDPTSFHKAMVALVEEREKEIETENVARNKLEYVFVVEKELFTEGIALVKLAKKLGIQSDHEYRYIPMIATSSIIISRNRDQVPKLNEPQVAELKERFSSIEDFTKFKELLEAYLSIQQRKE